MAQSRGIHQLITAERKALELLNEAKRRRQQRLKQARDEAMVEVAGLRSELEAKFTQYERQYMGNREEMQKTIDAEIQTELSRMDKCVEENREAVVERLLALVCDIHPELHHNLQMQKQIAIDESTTPAENGTQ